MRRWSEQTKCVKQPEDVGEVDADTLKALIMMALFNVATRLPNKTEPYVDLSIEIQPSTTRVIGIGYDQGDGALSSRYGTIGYVLLGSVLIPGVLRVPKWILTARCSSHRTTKGEQACSPGNSSVVTRQVADQEAFWWKNSYLTG